MSDHIPPNRPPNPEFDSARSLGGPLSAQLKAYDSLLRARNPAAGEAYQSLVDHLSAVDAGANAPSAGDPLPSFQLPDENGRLMSLSELLDSGPLVISFNRGNWCPYCWLELSALEDRATAIGEGGGAVVSITPEVAIFSRRLKNRLDLSFPVLTDLDNGYALELGLAISLNAAVREVYVKAGIDLGTFQRSDGWFLPIPATLVVDRRGIIRHSYVNSDFRERIEPGGIPGLLAEL